MMNPLCALYVSNLPPPPPSTHTHMHPGARVYTYGHTHAGTCRIIVFDFQWIFSCLHPAA